ncbi:MAG: hypothetical protein LBB57_00220 [Clostridiales Family XIII bacterium]|nr:hypothetical protein [Clostridiales Family XIII bacterium]
MDKMYIRFSLPELYDAALLRLKAAGRFDAAKEMHARMLDEALTVHCVWAEGAELAAVTACLAPAALRGPALRIAGASLVCPAFEQIDARNVVRPILYALTLRADERPEPSVSRLLYRDLWQNAYIEAALAALRARVAARTACALSDSFGPGYYGMALLEMKKLARALDFGRIGAAVLEDGSIQPPKSCAGIFFAVRDAARMPADACRSCAGDRAGCAFCEHRRRLPSPRPATSEL